MDSNQRPRAYQARALTTWAMSPFQLLEALIQSRLYGGDEGIRTPDPLRARQVLSQLSYTPISGTQMPLLPLFEGRAFKIEQHFRFAFQLKLTESYEKI